MPSLPNYPDRDLFMDYKEAYFDSHIIRGPIPNLDEPYFACLGSAHTFGRYCDYPYPDLLAQQLNLPVLNLAGGAFSPETYIRDFPKRIAAANKAKFVVIQIMSARFTSNKIYSYELDKPSKADWESLLNNPKQAKDIVRETRENYISDMNSLISNITAPKLVLYFSKRKPEYVESFDKLTSLFGNFPQLINTQVIKSLNISPIRYIEVVCNKGLPHQVTASITNNYYPSPEMHQEVAGALHSRLRVLDMI